MEEGYTSSSYIMKLHIQGKDTGAKTVAQVLY